MKQPILKACLIAACLSASSQVIAGDCPTAPSGFSGGSGTVEDPFLVCTPAQLQLVGSYLHAHFRQSSDIDLDSTFFIPIAFTSFGDRTILFEGTYDGGGFVISNLQINQPSTDVLGLFGKIGSSGVVHDIRLENVSLSGQFCVGVVAAENNGLIARCSAEGSVTALQWAGGLVGDNRASMEDCAARVSVSASGSPGGLVGVHFRGNPPSVVRCYATGPVFGGAGGGLVGSILSSSPTVSSSYWDIQVSGQNSSQGGVGLSTRQMMAASSYGSSWDFESIWEIKEGLDYPRLRQLQESNPADLDGDGFITAMDLAIILAAWGPAAPGSPPDLDQDGMVAASDLTVLLVAWSAI